MWNGERRQTAQQEMRETQACPSLDRRSRLETTDDDDQDGRDWDQEKQPR